MDLETHSHMKDYVLFKQQIGLANIQNVSEGVTFLNESGEKIIGSY